MRSRDNIRAEAKAIYDSYVFGGPMTAEDELRIDKLVVEYANLPDKSVRPTWDQYFLGVAKAVSARADCTRRKVGAVIASEDHRIVEAGYNGSPSGEPGCLTDGACARGRLSIAERPAYGSYDDCIAVHAEANAIILAGRRARGGTIYVTDWPCQGCFKLIKAIGIIRVVTTTEEWTKE